MNKIWLVSSGSFSPEKKLTNADLEKIVNTTDEWIVSRTGIRERRIAGEDMTTSEMGVIATGNCLAKAPDIIPDLLIASTGTPERNFPTVSSIVANALNLKGLRAAFDINAACSGLVYGMSIAIEFIRGGTAENAVITASENFTPFIDYKDRSTCILFGDGASSILLSNKKNDTGHEVLAFDRGFDASGSSYVSMGYRKTDFYFKQEGQKLFKYFVPELNRITMKLSSKIRLKKNEIFYMIPHQANRRIIEAFASHNNIPMDRIYINIDKYGNTFLGLHRHCPG